MSEPGLEHPDFYEERPMSKKKFIDSEYDPDEGKRCFCGNDLVTEQEIEQGYCMECI